MTEGAYLVKIGLRKGVSDFFLPLPRKNLHGLWIELKRTKKAKVSKEQLAWLDKMNSLGYAAHIAYGWVHAMNIVCAYLS